MRGWDILLGGTGGSLTHPIEKELGHSWRIRLSDSCLLTSLRDFLLPRRPKKTKELALLGGAVRELREQRRLSESELAAEVGVGEHRIQALEAGRLDPDYVLLVRLAKVLGVRAGALVSRAEGLADEADTSTDTPA